MTHTFTQHLKFAVPDFLQEPWHAELQAAFASLDQIVYEAVILQQATLWANSTVYTIGQVVISTSDGLLYTAATNHTSSAAPQTFAQEVIDFPGRWATFAPTIASQAEAIAGVENTHYMTPLRVKESVLTFAPIPATASQAEAEAGLDNTKMMTPLRVAQAIDAQTVSSNALPVPQARLCNFPGSAASSAVPTANVLGATQMFYAPHNGTVILVGDGPNSISVEEIGNGYLVTNLNDTAKNPAAVGANQVHDWFIWKDTMALTVTIASPAVVTTTGNHGLAAGQPVRFFTDGALPTGITQGAIYWVIATGLTAGTFQFSLSQGGAAVNTSGTQSGNHTITIQRLGHGPAWTNDTTRSMAVSKSVGYYWNGANITNGPAAFAGVYVGTTRSNGASQIDWNLGGAGAGGTPASLGVWNMFNRVPVKVMVSDTTASWTYATAVFRPLNNSVGNRISAVVGIREDAWEGRLGIPMAGAVGINGVPAVGYDSTTVPSGQYGFAQTASVGQQSAKLVNQPIPGYHFWQALEYASGATVTMWGTSGGVFGEGLFVSGKM